MEKSTSIVKIASALANFQKTVKAVGKDATNPFFKSKYATLENIIETIREPLAASGLSFAQFPCGKNQLATILMHESGEFIQGTVEMTPKDTSPQAQGSAITYMRRYSLSSVLGLATEEDDDGNEASAQKSNTTTVRTGKAGNEGAYAKAVIAIEKLTTTSKLEEALARLETSQEFSEGEKTKLEALISRQIDVLTNKDVK